MAVPVIGYVLIGWLLMLMGAAIYNYFGEYPILKYIAPIGAFILAGVGAYIIGVKLAPDLINLILIADSLLVTAAIAGWILYNIYNEATGRGA